MSRRQFAAWNRPLPHRQSDCRPARAKVREKGKRYPSFLRGRTWEERGEALSSASNASIPPKRRAAGYGRRTESGKRRGGHKNLFCFSFRRSHSNGTRLPRPPRLSGWSQIAFGTVLERRFLFFSCCRAAMYLPIAFPFASSHERACLFMRMREKAEDKSYARVIESLWDNDEEDDVEQMTKNIWDAI